MKNAYLLLALVCVLAACNPKPEKLKKEIDEREKSVMEKAKMGKLDSVAINALLVEYEDFAKDYPADTTGAGYLFKAADFYRYLHKPGKSIELYGKIYTNYPTYARRPLTLFLQGFVYENDLINIDSARVKYQQFLTAYPDHAIAKDVRITLQNLGKTPEQLIEEFETRQKMDSAMAQ